MGLAHLVHEVKSAITGCFRTDAAATPFETLTRENTLELMCELLIHAEEVTDFACTNTDITSRNVLVRTDMTIELGHERMAETHNFCIALTTW